MRGVRAIFGGVAVRLMRTRWRMVGWVIVGGLGVAFLTACAGAPSRDDTDTSKTLRPPAEPVYRRTFSTPGGGRWDFILGSDYSPERDR